MLTMNRATLLGFAGKHPEMRKLPSGDDAAQFSLATTERFRRKDDTVGEATQWHSIVAYGAAAEVVRTRVRKGDPVLVEGRIATRTWEDKAGNERRAIEIVVAGRNGTVNVLTKRKAGGNGGDDDPPGGAAAAAAAGAAPGTTGVTPTPWRSAPLRRPRRTAAKPEIRKARPSLRTMRAGPPARQTRQDGAAETGNGTGDGAPAPAGNDAPPAREADGPAEPGAAAGAAAPRDPAPSAGGVSGHD